MLHSPTTGLRHAVLTLLAVALIWPAVALGFVGEGQQLGEWKVVEVVEHPEFYRVVFEGPGGRTALEVGPSKEPGEWSTGRHQLMPAPGASPPPELLALAMDELRAYDAKNGPPLVRTREAHGGQAEQQRFRPRPVEPRERAFLPRWAPWALVGGLGGLLALVRVRRPELLERVDRGVERAAWPLLGMILLGMAWLLLTDLDQPFAADEMTQRVFFADAPLLDLARFQYDDHRHPPVFYVVLKGALLFGSSEAVVRAPAALFGLATLAAAFVLVRPVLGASRGLVVVLLLATNPTLLAHGREVGNTTLFLFFALSSTAVLLHRLRRPDADGLLVLLCLLEVGLLWTYYLASLVVLAQVLVLVVHRPRDRGLGRALGLAWLLGLPVLMRSGVALLADRSIRQLSAQYSDHLWGDVAPLVFLEQWAWLMAETGPARWLLLGLALAGAVRLGRNSLGLWALTVGIGAPLGLALLGTVARVKPEYGLLALPALALLAVAGAVGTPDRPTPRSSGAVGVVLISLLLASVGVHFAREAPLVRVPVDDRSQLRQIGERVRAEPGPRTVVADPDYLHTILLYYAFEDPFALYWTCRRPGEGQGLRCELGDQRLVTLTDLSRMSEGWERRAGDRLGEVLEEGSAWVVYVDHFQNQPLHEVLDARCVLEQSWRGDEYELWRCPEAR